jgi:hypothetical protein
MDDSGLEQQQTVAAFYHDPPLWIGKIPVDLQSQTVDFQQIGQEIVRKRLDCGIEVRANNEGLVTFDFNTWPPGCLTIESEDIPPDFDAVAEVAVMRTYVMNAYLAFFYTRLLTDGRFLQERMIVTPELLIPMRYRDGIHSGGYGNTRVMHLTNTRYPQTYNPRISPIHDYRIRDRVVLDAVPDSVAANAAEDLSKLMGSGENSEDVILLDLFLRGSKAYQDHNHSLSLISYWTIIEKLISALWSKFLTDNRTRNGEVFVNHDRRKRLNDNRNFPASVRIEMLSISGFVSQEVYEKSITIRKTRNDWLHNLSPVDQREVQNANRVCEVLIEQVKEVVVLGSAPRRIHG